MGMHAITLSRRNFREFDQVVSLYTKDWGKVELLARGIKKITSKQAAHVELFSFVTLEIAQGKELDHLTKAQTVNYFSDIRSDLRKSWLAAIVVNLVDNLVEVGEPDGRIYQALLDWLIFVNDATQASVCLVDGFVFKLLGYLGFKPIFDYCVVCRRIKTEVTNGWFYPAGGGIICEFCQPSKDKSGERWIALTPAFGAELASLLSDDWDQLNQLSVSVKVHQLVYEFLLFHTERKVVDWKQIIDN